MAETIITKLPGAKQIKDFEQWLKPTMSKTDIVDLRYSREINYITEMIKRHGVLVSIDANLIPGLFLDHQPSVKNVKMRFPDYH